MHVVLDSIKFLSTLEDDSTYIQKTTWIKFKKIHERFEILTEK